MSKLMGHIFRIVPGTESSSNTVTQLVKLTSSWYQKLCQNMIRWPYQGNWDVDKLEKN